MDDTRLQQLLSFLDDKSGDSFLTFAVAKEYEQLGMVQQATEYYQKLQKADPDYVGLYYHLAKLYESMSKDVLALKIYNDGIAVAKKLGDFHALSELNNAKVNLEITLGN